VCVHVCVHVCVCVCVVGVIKKTWESDVKHIIYFSDVEDDSVPTVTLGVANTQRGSFTLTFTSYIYTGMFRKAVLAVLCWPWYFCNTEAFCEMDITVNK